MNVAAKVLSRFLGMVVFVTVVYLSGYVLEAVGVSEPFVLGFLAFLEENIPFVILFSVILLTGEVLTALAFPLNLPAPVLNAAGIVLIFEFIYRIFSFMGSFTDENLIANLEPVKSILFVVVFFGVVLAGYVDIFSRAFGKKERRSGRGRCERDLSLEEVGEEFEEAIRHPKQFVSGFAEEFHFHSKDGGTERD